MKLQLGIIRGNIIHILPPIYTWMQYDVHIATTVIDYGINEKSWQLQYLLPHL